MLSWLRRPISKVEAASIRFLLGSQYWRPDQIRTYQWGKLHALIKHAYDHVPYYRNLFQRHNIRPENIQGFDDLKRIPVLTKRDIQTSLRELTDERTDPTHLSMNSTGGSTGMPLNFYHDDNYILWSNAARRRAWRYTVGATDADLEAVLWGAIRDIGKGSGLKRLVYRLLRERILLLNTFDLDESTLKKYLKYYNIFKPPIMRGYASSLYYVAHYIRTNSIRIHKPKAVISSTEVLHPKMRTTIEQVFECRVFDSYGCREVSQIATECESHQGLHIVFENQFLELNGQEILITNLNNFVMPFIRYQVGDLATCVDESPCSCGRFSPRIVCLAGRDNDNIELPCGKVINGEFFEFLFFGIQSVIQYQVIYHRTAGRMQIKLHLNEPSHQIEDMIRKTMAEKFRFSDIDIEHTDRFEKTPTGKLRFVYSVD